MNTDKHSHTHTDTSQQIASTLIAIIIPRLLLILQVEENREYRLHTVRPDTESVTFYNRRSVFGRFNLKTGRYVLVPSTFEAGKEREFLLRVYAEHNAHPL